MLAAAYNDEIITLHVLASFCYSPFGERNPKTYGIQALNFLVKSVYAYTVPSNVIIA